MAIASGARGLATPVRQPDRVGWDPIRGATRWAVWRCIDDAQVAQLADQYLALRLPYNITSTGTIHSIEVEIAGGAIAPAQQIVGLDRWEMPGNEIQKDKWQNTKALWMPAELVILAKRHIEDGKIWNDFIQNAQNYPNAGGSGTTNLTNGFTSEQLLQLHATYLQAGAGNTNFALGQYVLKHTTSVGQGFADNVADHHVEQLYTTDQLLQECTDPTLWVFPLPPRLVYKIQNIPAPPAQSNFLWSWRKLPSTEAATAGGRVEISTEYWLEQWSTIDYDPISGPVAPVL